MKTLTVKFDYHAGDKNIGIAQISGEVDLSNVDRFSEFLDETLARSCSIVIFVMKGLTYMNSTGFGALSSRIVDQEEKRIIFCKLEKNFRDTLTMFGLDSVCQIESNLEDALASTSKISLGHHSETQDDLLAVSSQNIAKPKVPTLTIPKIQEAKQLFPLIKHCPSCKKQVKFRKPGHYKCPHCSVIHYVDQDGALRLISEPLKPSLPMAPLKHGQPNRIEISLPSDPNHLKKIRDFIISFTVEDFSEDDCSNFAMVVDEACSNAIEHAHSFDHNRLLRLSLYITAEKFSITITDSGKNTYREGLGEIQKPNFKQTGRGMGFLLMRKMMDQVEIKKTPQGGTSVTLIKINQKKK